LVKRAAIFGFLTAVLLGNLVLAFRQPKTTSAPPDATDTRPAAERLASRKVSSYSELTEQAAAAGLGISRRFVGTVESIERIDDHDVTMAGWLGDIDGDGTPLNVVVFVAGNAAGMARTQGERPDLTNKTRFTFGAEKNIDFRVRFSCRTGDQPIVAGLGPKERYIPLASPRCP
jgi:hypothetical protein